MNFNSLNKIFEDKFTISKKLLREEASLKSKKEKSKKKLTESIDRNLTERDWKLTIPGSFRDDMLNAGEEEDFDKVKNILIDMCNYVVEHIDESNFDLDDQEYVIEEFEDFIEELEYVDFEDEDEANYYLNDLYDLLDNTDIFLGLRESLNESINKKDLINAVKDAYGFTNKEALEYIKKIDDKTKQALIDGFKSNAKKSFYSESLKEEKITGGSMPKEDINIIQPLIDDFDSLEDANKDSLSITWNFGRRNSDNKMTAGVDIYFLSKGSEENLQPYLKQVEDIILSDGYKFDDSLGYDLDPWKAHTFGDGYHTQIIEDAEEVVEESFGYKPSFDEWYFQETGVNTSDLTDEQYDELWDDEDLMNHYRKFCDGLDESLNESKYRVGRKFNRDNVMGVVKNPPITSYEEIDKIFHNSKFTEYLKKVVDKIYDGDITTLTKEEAHSIYQDWKLLHESLNEYEKDLGSGYYPDKWDTDFEDELENLGIEPQRGVYIGYQYRVPNRRFASKMVRLAKEFGYDDSWVEGNILYLKWSRPEREYHKTPYDESLNESWVLFFDEDGINHAGSDGAHKFNLSPKIIERKIKSSDYHLPNWAESYIILSDSEFHKMDYDEIEKYHKRYGKTLNEDTVKQGGKWVNKGKEGTHGKFKTKKEADAQRKAMFANGYKG